MPAGSSSRSTRMTRAGSPATLRRRGVSTVAVCFINSYANPANERRMKEILEEELPGVAVSTSSEILPEIFEYERFSTTVANAVLSPLVVGYTTRLGERLAEAGYEGDLLLLHSGGGVMTPRSVERLAVRLAASGIAAGAIASRQIAGLCGHANAIGLDMGGTSTDISLVYEGELRVTKEWFGRVRLSDLLPFDRSAYDRCRRRIARVDRRGRVATERAAVCGRRSGPARLRSGGQNPTNTDANLYLGRLGGQLIGGAMKLDRVAAERAIRTRIADPLGLDVDGGGERNHSGRERQYGRRGEAHLDPTRIRSARVRAGRLRRGWRRCTARRLPGS